MIRLNNRDVKYVKASRAVAPQPATAMRYPARVEETRAERAVARAGRQREARLGHAGRKARGAIHTPPVLARFVIDAADQLARDELGLAGGLVDHRAALVDPACGPGAFLAAALAVAGDRVGRPALAIGLDRDPGAVAMARALLRRALSRACWDNELAVVDTLQDVEPATVAARAPVSIVVGNPPWIGTAQQPPSAWLDTLLEDFRRDDSGARLAERKLGVLSDAYVRFLRWGAEVVRCAPEGGVLALVTNGSYLDGPVHRGMRAALRRFFDELRVIDLGGNALLSRPGVRDGNVFGVRTSAAVLLGVRRADCDETRPAQVHHRALAGSADEKLALLGTQDAARELTRLDPAPPFVRFVPTAAAGDYARWPSLADAIVFHREGVQTNRDAVVIDASREALLDRLRRFAEGTGGDDLALAERRLNHYCPERARSAVREALERDPDGTRGISARPIDYRPFDRRWFAPIAPLCHRPRPALLSAMDHASIALVTVRKDRSPAPWAHFGATTLAIDNCLLSARSSCRARAFPSHGPKGEDNLSVELARELGERLGREVRADEWLLYALAVLASPAYRERHREALGIDYPRIQWPQDGERFAEVVSLGRELARLLQASPSTAVRGRAGPGRLVLGHHRLDGDAGHVAALARCLATLPDPAEYAD